MFILFLSVKVGAIAILPNLFPIVVNFGIMGWLGIELSMATSLIASIAIGLAVAGLVATGDTYLSQAEVVRYSYPGFFEDLQAVQR